MPRFSTQLPATLVLDYGTLRAIAKHLSGTVIAPSTAALFARQIAQAVAVQSAEQVNKAVHYSEHQKQLLTAAKPQVKVNAARLRGGGVAAAIQVRASNSPKRSRVRK